MGHEIDFGALLLGWISAVFAFVLQDVPLAIFGTHLSVVVAGFAGVMTIMSLLPPFPDRRKMWIVVACCTMAASYLTRLGLHFATLDDSYSLGVSYAIGFFFPWLGTGLVKYTPKIWEAFIHRISGSGRSE